MVEERLNKFLIDSVLINLETLLKHWCQGIAKSPSSSLLQSISDGKKEMTIGLQKVSAIFSSEVSPLVREANEIKDRFDHDTNNMERYVWHTSAEQYNNIDRTGYGELISVADWNLALVCGAGGH
jgi:hypothetical protein